MNELVKQNQMTLDQHVEKIQLCLNRVKTSLMDTALAIRECRDDLGGEIFGKDLAVRLGMSTGTLSKWLAISESATIKKYQKQLPSTFSSLYSMTQVEKTVKELFPQTWDEKHLQPIFEKKRITNLSEDKDIKEVLDSFTNQLKKRKKGKSADQINILPPHVNLNTKNSSIVELIQANKKFRGFIVIPENKIIDRWSDDGFFEEDIYEKYPIRELQYPSTAETNHCLVLVPGSKIHVGLKILSAFGFNFRDFFAPTHSESGLTKISNDQVVVRGEKGTLISIKQNTIPSTNPEDLMELMESLSSGPYISVFEKMNNSKWTTVLKHD